MTGLASVTVNGNKSIASVGAGATWLDVYRYLDGFGVAVAGGRNAAVGVGGLTIGGVSLPRFAEIPHMPTPHLCRWDFLFRATGRMVMRQRCKF